MLLTFCDALKLYLQTMAERWQITAVGGNRVGETLVARGKSVGRARWGAHWGRRLGG